MNLGDARLPSGVLCFILDSMFARNSIWPSLDRVTRLIFGVARVLDHEARIACMPALPPMRSRSLFQLLP